jgi:4-aminobutyrate aminotransferase-like enzyme
MIARVFAEERDIYAFRHAYHGLVGNARTVTNLGTWSSTQVDRLNCVRLGLPKANGEESLREIKDIVRTTSADRPGVLVY